MPRTIHLQPASLLAGVGFALLAFVAMGQSPVSNRPQLDHESPYLQVAHPRDWVMIRGGVPYIVPSGKRFVPTALGRTVQAGSNSELLIDGLPQVGAGYSGNGGPLMLDVPIGLSALPDSVVEVASNSLSVARAWGVLVDADAPTFQLSLPPGPTEWLTIREGSSFSVPPGTLLVIAAIGTNGGGSQTTLSVDGSIEVTTLDPFFYNDPSMSRLPTGLAVSESSAVEVADDHPTLERGRAWGYLVDA